MKTNAILHTGKGVNEVMTKLNPYINFKDKAREAMDFYKAALGGNLTRTTFKEGQMSQGPEDENLIMHSQLDTDNGMTIMASDVPPHMEFKEGSQVSISLSGDNESELSGYWDKLKEGATITAPLEKAPWGDTFGMLTDKFGINWMVNITAKKA